ncbi:MAG TPA: putative lipid II flippase FtsW [Dermatophilaceae bacterium]|nr:putative lipid II flippase FtsW [Dermatophilaceae bacterium]
MGAADGGARSRVADVGGAAQPGLSSSLASLARRFDSPVTSYYLIVGTTTALLLIGLVMVLSASMVTSYKDDGSSYAVFLNQARFAGIGLVGAVIAARLSVAWWKRLAIPSLGVAVLLQALVFVPGLGLSKGGNRNWLKLTSTLSLQPSELTKIGLVLVGALILANKRALLGRVSHAIVPYLVPVAAVTIGLVLVGHDLGTALVLIAIVGAVMYAAGVPGRLFVAAVGAAAVLAAVLVLTSANRMDRITNWLSGSCNDPNGECGQAVHGLYALADGGWWGVGLGASKEKWSWLPEAHNDFIFAIIGEELGLPGTFIILALFAVIATACYRIVSRSTDQFVRIAAAGAMAWILGQAMINIGAVIGLLPVIGVPLPLVSAGGSALVTTLLAMGMLVSFARTEPGAAEILAARPGVIKRSLAVLPRRRQR